MRLFIMMCCGLGWMSGATAHAGELSVGDAVPLFKALDQDGKSWSLKKQLGDKFLILYFYPAAMTGGCTRQACAYRDYVKTANDSKLTIVGISGDVPESLKYFKEAEGLNFTLLSDSDGAIAKAFGVPTKHGDKTIKRTVNGKEVSLLRKATTARWTFVISPSGKVVYKNAKVRPTADLAEIIELLKKPAE